MVNEAALMHGRKIGFLGGGNMAAALIRGLLHSATVTPDPTTVVFCSGVNCASAPT